MQTLKPLCNGHSQSNNIIYNGLDISSYIFHTDFNTSLQTQKSKEMKKHLMLIVLVVLLITGMCLQSCDKDALPQPEIEMEVPVQEEDSQHLNRGITIAPK